MVHYNKSEKRGILNVVTGANGLAMHEACDIYNDLRTAVYVSK